MRRTLIVWVLAVAPALADEREVFLQNNTERTLQVMVLTEWERFVDATGDDTVFSRALAPGERARVARVESDEIPSGQLAELRFCLFPANEPQFDEDDVLQLRVEVERDGTTRMGVEGVFAPTRDARHASTTREAWGRLDFAVARHGSRVELALRSVPAPPPDRPHTLRLLAWNLYLLPGLAVSTGQRERARLMPEVLRGFDVLVLQETFNDAARADLLAGLRADYPHQTGILGKDTFPFGQDGGVVIVSRWPIERTAQLRYARRSGNDALAQKGVMYACVNKQGRRCHVFGTHAQAGPRSRDKMAIRAAQFDQLAAFVREQAIPADEPVLIAGDLNVTLSVDDSGAPTGETEDMLDRLGAVLPEDRRGLAHTVGADLNSLSHGASATLDYVLWSSAHLAPERAHVTTRLLRAPHPVRYGRDGDLWTWDLSDHFAVEAVLELPAVGATSSSAEPAVPLADDPGAGLVGGLGQ